MTVEPADPEELRTGMLEMMAGLSEDAAIRIRFELDAAGRHIGTLSSCYLDEAYEPVPWAAIDQSKNAAENHVIRGLGERRFLVKTWSGSKRMLRCAEKFGFREVNWQKDFS